MPGRGLLAVGCLVVIALTCLVILRALERERRFLRKLRTLPDPVLTLDQLSDDEHDCAGTLARAGVLILQDGRCHLCPGELAAFRARRIRLTVCSALIAALLAAGSALFILRH